MFDPRLEPYRPVSRPRPAPQWKLVLGSFFTILFLLVLLFGWTIIPALIAGWRPAS